MEGGLSVSIWHDGIDLFLHCVKFLKYYLLPCNNRVRFLYTILFFFFSVGVPCSYDHINEDMFQS